MTLSLLVLIAMVFICQHRKVASSRLSRLVVHPKIFRRLMKGKFYPYVLWPLTQKFQNLIVDRSTARDFTVMIFSFYLSDQRCLIVIDPEHKIGFCRNPKVTSTTWLARFKIILENLEFNHTFSRKEQRNFHESASG